MAKSLPFLLATLSALFWFPPIREHLVGWGSDPSFNVWTLEEVWKHLGQFGLFHLFSAEMWNDPIFYPLPLTHTLSENFLYTGVLSWPIRALTGNGVLTMNILGLLMSLAAFVFCGLWLRKLGARNLCWWGGLVFSACGWLQSQNAHYQNICIFLFPLSFWLWLRFLEKASLPRFIACAVAFSWILGWNMYFQVFSNLIFCGLVALQWKNKPLRAKLLALGALVVALQLPILIRYLQMESLIGSMGIGLDDYRDNSASLMSFISRVGPQSLLQRLLPFYPHVSLGIEAAGFVGIMWVILAIQAFRRPKSEGLRIWIALALLAYLVSLGPDFLVMHAFRLFPGFGALRAIGRAQLLVLLASLPAVCLLLERQQGWKKFLLLGLVLLELLPGELPKRVFISEKLYSQPTAFAEKAGALVGHEPLLVIPTVNTDFQLASLQLDSPLFGGYSGRYPANAFLLSSISGDPRLAAEFSGSRWIASFDAPMTEKLKGDPGFSFRGCYDDFGLHPCLFEVSSPVAQPKIRLDRDVTWEYPPQRKGHLAIARASKDGILDYESLGTCKLASYLKFPVIPEISVVNTMAGVSLRGVKFKSGEVIFEQKSPQGIFSLPLRWRPSKRYEIICGG